MKTLKTTAEIGAYGERLAVRYLRLRGYAIRARNWRTGHFELDVVAETLRDLAFVEVKTRKKSTDSEKYGKAQDAVTEEKRAHLRYAAARYITECRMQYLKPRFDVAEVYYTEAKKKKFKVFYRKEAF